MSFGWRHVTIWGGRGYRGGFWGPAGFYPRPPYRGYPGYGYPGYRPPGYRPGYRPPGYRPPGQPGYRPPPGGATTLPSNRANLYGRASDTVGKGVQTPAKQPVRAPQNMQNNVYTDKSGNVYRRDQNGSWDRRDNGAWKSTTPQAKPGAAPSKPSQQPAPNPQLQRDYQARQQGSQKAQSFQGGGGSRPTQSPAAPKTAPRKR